MNRVYVRVECMCLEDGTVEPMSIIWSDGRVWKIDRILHSCTSKICIPYVTRYTVLIGKAEKHIYFTGNRWFVQPKDGVYAC